MRTSTCTACLALALVLLAAAAPGARAQSPFNASAARDVRYCEVVLYYPIPGNTEYYKAMAYNTIGVDNCTTEDWQTVVDNLDEYVVENNATAGDLNGPRYFTYDGVYTPGGDTNPGLYAPFGPFEMEADGIYQEAINSTGTDNMSSYQTSQVTRTTTYTFNAGEWVYQLTDAEGETYWLQSYSQQLYPWNATLLQDVPATRALLTELPAGWSYDAFVLPETVQQIANGTAVVLSDQYINNYQRTNEPWAMQ